MGPHVFVDESRRSCYLLAAALLNPRELAGARSMMRRLCLPGERRVHFQAERDARRRMIATELVTAGVRGRVYFGRGPAEAIRGACLTELVADVVARGAGRLVLESRGHTGDRVDRRVIHGAVRDQGGSHELAYEHLRPYEDPALAIADGIAWCFGAGGEWQRRIMPVIEEVIEVPSRRTRQR